MPALKGSLWLAASSLTAAHVCFRPLGAYRVGLAPHGLEAGLEALAWVVLAALARRRRRYALALVAVLPRFAIMGGDRVTAMAHVMRLLLFRRLGLRLPPTITFFEMLPAVTKFGLWERHKIERFNRERFGLIFAVMPPFGQLTVAVSDPDMVEQVMCDKDTYPSRGHTGFADKDTVEEGLLGLPTGPKWSHHRRIISKFFTTAYLDRFSTIVAEETRVTIRKWQACAKSGDGLNAHYDLSMLTLDIILRCAFDVDDSERRQTIPEAENVEAADLDRALKEVVLRTVSPLYKWLPNPRRALLHAGRARAIAAKERIFGAAMKRIESGGNMHKNMLSELIRERNDDGSRALCDKEISDELLTMRGAGHETTSNTLCWTLLLLARHPNEMAKLQAEVDAKVTGDVPTFAEVKLLAAAHRAIFESLRLFPTVPSFPRAVQQDAKLGGYDVPRGSRVFVSQGAMNTDASLWQEPLAFQPDRFAEVPQLAPSLPVGVPGGHRFGFVPFGAGPRTCIGQRLALMEAVQILAALIKRFDIALTDPGAAVAETADITLGPKAGLSLHVSERSREFGSGA